MANLAKAIKRDLAALHQRPDHPPKRPALLAELDQQKPWLRFTFRLDGIGEFGMLGRILAGLCGDRRSFYFEPLPEDDIAIYVKNEADNKQRVIDLAKEANLRPTGFMEVERVG